MPEETHRRIKARAALAGMSMSEHILRELQRSLERPTREELLARIARRDEAGAELDPAPAAAVRSEREGR